MDKLVMYRMKKNDLENRVEALEEFRDGVEIDQKVKAIVKMRCAVAWSSVLFFITCFGSIVGFYSDIVKDASKAALKVIMEHLK